MLLMYYRRRRPISDWKPSPSSHADLSTSQRASPTSGLASMSDFTPNPTNITNSQVATSADHSTDLKSKTPSAISIIPGENRIPKLLLLAMFAVAARYRAAEAPLPPSNGDMWNAGDDYLEDAKRILSKCFHTLAVDSYISVALDQTYASSRPSTCQALLLLSYREIGIGAMAQAWLYVGMAVRMVGAVLINCVPFSHLVVICICLLYYLFSVCANLSRFYFFSLCDLIQAQDLGMHRSADRWQRTGSELFSEMELQVRKRIWFSCVVMDKYVSTYIG